MKSDCQWGRGSGGSISHPSGMLWRPFGGHFLQILQPKRVFRSLFLCISCIYETSKPVPVAKGWQLQWERVLTFRTLIVKAMGTCFGNEKVFWMSLKVVEVDKTKCQNTSPLQKIGEWPDNGRFWFFTVPLNFLMGNKPNRGCWISPKL